MTYPGSCSCPIYKASAEAPGLKPVPSLLPCETWVASSNFTNITTVVEMEKKKRKNMMYLCFQKLTPGAILNEVNSLA
jgi:hypothetical protein